MLKHKNAQKEEKQWGKRAGGEGSGWNWVGERTERTDVKGEKEEEKEEEKRRCGDIDSLASQQFNTTELLLHSSPYEMRSLSPELVFSLWLSVCLYMCLCTMSVSACVYQYMWSTYERIDTLQSGFKNPPFFLSTPPPFLCISSFLFLISLFLFFSRLQNKSEVVWKSEKKV